MADDNKGLTPAAWDREAQHVLNELTANLAFDLAHFFRCHIVKQDSSPRAEARTQFAYAMGQVLNHEEEDHRHDPD